MLGISKRHPAFLAPSASQLNFPLKPHPIPSAYCWPDGLPQVRLAYRSGINKSSMSLAAAHPNADTAGAVGIWHAPRWNVGQRVPPAPEPISSFPFGAFLSSLLTPFSPHVTKGVCSRWQPRPIGLAKGQFTIFKREFH